jgi:hypothetical protein
MIRVINFDDNTANSSKFSLERCFFFQEGNKVQNGVFLCKENDKGQVDLYFRRRTKTMTFQLLIAVLRTHKERIGGPSTEKLIRQ